MDAANSIKGNMLYDNAPRSQQEMLERSMRNAQQQAKEFNARQVPVTLVEHMTDPRAAQLQMLFASLDEYGKKVAIAQIAALVKLHKDSNHG